MIRLGQRSLRRSARSFEFPMTLMCAALGEASVGMIVLTAMP
jgi:hypothetical protein